jgi:two-component system sensor histidine kinase/response regulator
VLGYPDDGPMHDPLATSKTHDGDEAAESDPADAEFGMDTKRPLNVLLVEDNLVNQKLAIGVLGKNQHAVTVANNGREAVEHFQTGKFDLILMDVQMPVMDGFEATAQIRELESRSGIHTPILAMTARAMESDREECLAAGMDDYLSKPIRIAVLMEKLNSLMKAARATSFDASETALGSSSPENQSSPAEPAGSNTVSVDWEFARSSVNGDQELLNTLVAIVLKETPKWIGEIESSVSAGDAAGLQLHAHTLKGSLRFLGPLTFSETAESLEIMGKAGSLKNAPPLVPVLKQRWEQLASELAKE